MFDFLLAPLVVALRVPVLMQEAQRMVLGGVSSDSSPEARRMVAEKIAAVNEGVLQAAVEISRVNMELGMLALQGNAVRFLFLAHRGPHRVAAAASSPSGKRVRSNARRLSGR
jgi:hypothetical protein